MDKINNLLLCVGAQKAGTTWLYSILKNSEEISFARYKEVHYFDMVDGLNNQLPNRVIRDISKNLQISRQKLISRSFQNQANAIRNVKNFLDDDWYISRFNKEAKYSADFSPEYALLSEAAFKKVKSISNNQKIIFIMRDPVNRAESALKYFYQIKNINIEDVSLEELRSKMQSKLIIPKSQYEKTIRILDKEFDAKDVLYLFYEDIMKDKRKHLGIIADFLDIEVENPASNELHKRVNKSRLFDFDESILSVARGSLEETYLYVKNRFGYMPGEWSISNEV